MDKEAIQATEIGLTKLFNEVAGGTPTVDFVRAEKAGPVVKVEFEPGEIARAIRCQRAVVGWGDKVLSPAVATQPKPSFTFQMIRKPNT